MNINRPNSETIFNVDLRDGFYSPNKCFLYINGNVLHADGKNYAAADDISLVDNFGAHLFKSGSVKVHNHLVNQVENMGQTSTIKGTVSFAMNGNGLTIESGFQSKFTTGANYFYAFIPLHELGFTYFKDTNFPAYSGFQLSLVRNENNDAIRRDAKLPEAKIVLYDAHLIVYPVEYDEPAKVSLIKELTDLSHKNEYILQFKTWQTIMKTGISGKSITLPLTNLYRSNRNPLFVMFAFQKGRRNNQLVSTSLFDNMSLCNYYVEINGRKYPEDGVKANFKDGDVSQTYCNHLDYRRRYGKETNMIPYLTPVDFTGSRPIFVSDVVRQPDNISMAKPSIILHAEFQNEIKEADNVDLYVILVYNSGFYYNIVRNDVKEIL